MASAAALNSTPPPTGLHWVWCTTIDCVKGSFDLITYLFFRTLARFKPDFAEKAENIWRDLQLVWLRLKNHWNNKWWEERCQTLEVRINTLVLEKTHLEQQRDRAIARGQELLGERNQLRGERDQLALDKGNLGRDVEEKSAQLRFSEEGKEKAAGELSTCQEQMKELRRSRDFFNDKSDSLAMRCDELRARNEKFQQILSEKEEALSDLKYQLQEALKQAGLKEFRKQWLSLQAKIASHWEKIATLRTAENQPGIDQELEELLSTLQEQEALTLRALQEKIESFPPNHPTKEHLETLALIAKTRREFFQKEAEQIAMHSKLHFDLAELSNLLPQENK